MPATAQASMSATLYWVDRENGMVWRTANVLKAGNGGALPEAYKAEDGKEMATGEQRRE